MKKISVIVTVYNQSLKGILATIDSAINQEFSDFEIIIADDCSPESHMAEVEEHLRGKGFQDYKIIENEVNVGTVKNLIGAMQAAEGKYVKDIGADDLLYDKDTLKKLYDFCESRRIDFAFGKIKTFQCVEDDLAISAFNAPAMTDIYSDTWNSEAVLQRQLLHSDWIPGAALFFRTDIALEYFIELANDYGVVYCEDLVSPLVALERQIYYLDEFVLWYEWGVGISTDGKPESRAKMYKDHSCFFQTLSKKHPSSGLIKKANWLFKLKRFLVLHTPMQGLLRKISAKHYFENDTKDDTKADSGEFFLRSCTGGA